MTIFRPKLPGAGRRPLPPRTAGWTPRARRAAAALAAITLCGGGPAAVRAAGIPANGTPGDWQQFGYDPRHSGVAALETTLNPGNVGTLHLLYSVSLFATVDSAPVFLSGVPSSSGPFDMLFLTATNGEVIAVDAATGKIRWSRQPGSGPQYTTSAPAIDPNRQLVYTYGLEGVVNRFQVADGGEVPGAGWPQVATLKPEVEKCSPALAIATAANGHSYLYVANGGYPGDAGDYQGHVTAVDLRTGVQHVWNADCSDQPVHFTHGSPDCPSVQSAVWARGGVVYDSDLDRILFSTGNGSFDVPQGRHDWGDSVIELRPNATGSGGAAGTQPLDSYTPTNFQQLQDSDADLGSTVPAVLPAVPGSRFPHLAVQSGKDGKLRLLNLDNLSGQGQPGKVGGELQSIQVPQGGEVLTAIAVWTDPASGTPWIFVANDSGLSGLQVVAGGDGMPALTPVWTDPHGGTSPVVAGAMVLYVGGAGLRALSARHGALLWSDGGPAAIHWQSPIVVNGRVYVADGNGTLWAYAPRVATTCVPDATTLCLQNGRFQVRASWQTGQQPGSRQATGRAAAAAGATGDGQAVRLTADTGTFWFFSAGNIELVTKVLNGCGLDNHFWVFAGGLTDVRVVITVTDTANGAVKVYQNPQGTPFAPLQDTNAFACTG